MTKTLQYKTWRLRHSEGARFDLFENVPSKDKHAVNGLIDRPCAWSVPFEWALQYIITEETIRRQDTTTLESFIKEYHNQSKLVSEVLTIKK